MACGLAVVVGSRKDAGARCVRGAEGTALWRDRGEEAVVGRLVQASWRAVWAEEAMERPVEAWWGDEVAVGWSAWAWSVESTKRLFGRIVGWGNGAVVGIEGARQVT